MRNVLAAAGLAVLLAAPAGAFDISEMNEGEREAFRGEVRAYLLDNPEVLMEAIAVLEQRRAEEAAEFEAAMLEENREAIFDDGYSFVGGNPDGDITMVEFLDYRCGYCRRAFPDIESLVETDGNIRFVVKEFPILGAQSIMASSYAIATKNVAGDEAYKQVHDALMTMRSEVNEDTLARLSEGLGLDHDAIAVEMESDAVREIISANIDLGRTLQIQGTPTFVVGERFVRGYVEAPEMKRIIREIRATEG